MNKLHLADPGIGWYMFHCPGCNTTHSFWTSSPDHPNWNFNNNLENPTISPSHRVSMSEGTICHSFIKDGNIQFLNDSKHHLAGKTVELPPFD